MNEPLIILRVRPEGHPVRHFVDAEAPPGGGAARHERRGAKIVQDLAQRARRRTTELGHAAAALAAAGLELARRR